MLKSYKNNFLAMIFFSLSALGLVGCGEGPSPSESSKYSKESVDDSKDLGSQGDETTQPESPTAGQEGSSGDDQSSGSGGDQAGNGTKEPDTGSGGNGSTQPKEPTEPAEPKEPSTSAPVIVNNLSSSSEVSRGETVTISVSASGSPAPRYSWFKNGKPISYAQNQTVGKLTFAVDIFNTQGSYHAEISNSAGSVKSAVMKVTVKDNFVRLEDLESLPVSLQKNGKFIFHLYDKLLKKHDIDVDGFKYWLSQMGSGVGCGAVASGFVDAGIQYMGTNIGFPDGDYAFISQLDEGLLTAGNGVSEDGKYKLEAALSRGLSRKDAGHLFINSYWFKDLCENKFGLSYDAMTLASGSKSLQYIYRLYKQLFNRLPDVGGTIFYMDGIEAAGVSCTNIAASFIDNGINGNAFPQSNEEFVRMIYRAAMDREADQGGLDYYVNELASRDRYSVGLDVLEGFRLNEGLDSQCR